MSMNPNKVIIPCRFSYLHCWEPDSVNGLSLIHIFPAGLLSSWAFAHTLPGQFASATAVSTYQRATRLAKAEFVHSKKRRFSSPRITTV